MFFEAYLLDIKQSIFIPHPHFLLSLCPSHAHTSAHTFARTHAHTQHTHTTHTHTHTQHTHTFRRILSSLFAACAGSVELLCLQCLGGELSTVWYPPLALVGPCLIQHSYMYTYPSLAIVHMPLNSDAHSL